MEVCYKGSIRINKRVVEKQKVHWELKSSIDDPQLIFYGNKVVLKNISKYFSNVRSKELEEKLYVTHVLLFDTSILKSSNSTYIPLYLPFYYLNIYLSIL